MTMNKQQISRRIIENHQNFTEFISTLNEAEFMYSADGKWTAGQQLDHLVRGVSPVRTALTLPKFVTKSLFGKANRSSTSYEHLVSNYQGKLALGSKASGRFIPPSINFVQRQKLTNKLLKTVAGLCQRLEKFSESQLDEHLLPHPILGKLTIREMLYFTIYHCEHHHRAVLRNLEK
jgi:DinB superfamily